MCQNDLKPHEKLAEDLEMIRLLNALAKLSIFTNDFDYHLRRLPKHLCSVGRRIRPRTSYGESNRVDLNQEGHFLKAKRKKQGNDKADAITRR